MSKRKSKAITIGKSERKCPHCGREMIVRGHKEITPKLRNQFYYFSQWDYCIPCKDVFFDEKYKVTNPKGQIFEEFDRQQSFLNSL